MKLFMGFLLLDFLFAGKAAGMERGNVKRGSSESEQISINKSKKRPPARRRSADDYHYGKKKERRRPSKNTTFKCDEEKTDRRVSLPVLIEAKYRQIAPIKSGKMLVGYANYDELVVLDSLKKNILGRLIPHDDQSCLVMIDGIVLSLKWINIGGWWVAEKWPFLDFDDEVDSPGLYTFRKARRSISFDELSVSAVLSGASGFFDDGNDFQFASISPLMQEAHDFADSKVDVEIEDEEKFGFDE